MEDALGTDRLAYNIKLIERHYATLDPWWNASIDIDGRELFWCSAPTKEGAWDMVQEFMFEELTGKPLEEC